MFRRSGALFAEENNALRSRDLFNLQFEFVNLKVESP